MHAEDIAEDFPVVSIDSGALDAARLLAEHRLPGIVVTDSAGKPYAVLPASQVVRFIVPRYVLDDPALAGVLNDSAADRAAQKLGGKTVRDVLPEHLVDVPAANADDTIIEVAALMVRLRSPLIAVLKNGKLHGVITHRGCCPRRWGTDPMAVLAVTVFVVAYALIASDRINKTVVALSGAAIVVAVGVVGSADVFYSHEAGIDWDVIFLLLGMMIIVGVLRQTGVFEYIAIWSAKRAKGSPLRIMILLVLVTAVASALLDNVTTVLLIAPVTLLVCDRLAINPIPFLMAEVFASNIGGAATLVGDPPNIIIASRAGLSFNDFLVHMAPIVIVVMVVFVAMLPRLFRGSFDVDPQRVADVMSLNEREAIRDPRLLVKCGVVLVGCSPPSSPTRCCTSRPRWWRCSAPASWS